MTVRRAVGDALAASIVMVIVGAFSLASGRPILFASLGPTALLQIEYPEHRAARFYNTVVGHLAAATAAFLAVIVSGAQSSPVATRQLSPERVLAATVALGLTIVLTRLLRASHPPAASTALLIALGGFDVTLHDAATIAIGVVLVAIVGGGVRRLRGAASAASPSEARRELVPDLERALLPADQGDDDGLRDSDPPRYR